MADTFPGWPSILGHLAAGDDLTEADARAAMGQILAGAATPAQIAAFIVALRLKGEASDELVGMVDAMLAAAEPLVVPDTAVDIVGTGGAASRREHALNVSTMASFVVAGAGVPVCKHGNRKASSTSGSFDLLEALGVAVELDGDAVATCVEKAGVGFCFARLFHPAMRHAAPVRAELGIPTVFNFLGPLSHPGGVTRQVIGVADPSMADLVFDVVRRRGAPRAMVVHGDDGLDELSLTTTSTIREVRDGETRTYQVDPAELGLSTVSAAELAGGDPEANARLAQSLLSGAGGPVREIVALNAAAGLVVGGAADDLREGLDAAFASIDDGRARASLDELVAVSGSTAG